MTTGVQGLGGDSQVPNNMQQPLNFYDNQFDESTGVSNMAMHQPKVPFPQNHPGQQMPYSMGSTGSMGTGISGGDYLVESTNRTKNFLNELITP